MERVKEKSPLRREVFLGVKPEPFPPQVPQFVSVESPSQSSSEDDVFSKWDVVKYGPIHDFLAAAIVVADAKATPLVIMDKPEALPHSPSTLKEKKDCFYFETG